MKTTPPSPRQIPCARSARSWGLKSCDSAFSELTKRLTFWAFLVDRSDQSKNRKIIPNLKGPASSSDIIITTAPALVYEVTVETDRRIQHQIHAFSIIKRTHTSTLWCNTEGFALDPRPPLPELGESLRFSLMNSTVFTW